LANPVFGHHIRFSDPDEREGCKVCQEGSFFTSFLVNSQPTAPERKEKKQRYPLDPTNPVWRTLNINKKEKVEKNSWTFSIPKAIYPGSDGIPRMEFNTEIFAPCILKLDSSSV